MIGMNFINFVILVVISILLGLAVWTEALRQAGFTFF